jgi:alanine racemase
MKASNTFSTWIEVDLTAIENNVKLLKQDTRAELMSVVKANAYGHGMLPVALASIRGGATWLGVARIEEALELRNAGIEKPVLIFGHTPIELILKAISNEISLTVWNLQQIEHIAAAAQELGKRAKLHLKVDTGMSRLGAHPEDVIMLGRKINNESDLIFEGIFTHFARADESDPTTTESQEHLFREVIDALTTAGQRPQFAHAANSAAILSRPSAHFDLVRAGIAIYGLHPSREIALMEEFRAALTWKTILSQVRALPPGRGISYGHEYVTKATEKIGTLPVGYADGFRRIQGNHVLVGGKLAPIVGRVCMDQVMVQLDEVSHARQGDEVVLIGKQGDMSITAEQIAELWGTINYEVVCGLGSRVPRVYC